MSDGAVVKGAALRALCGLAERALVLEEVLAAAQVAREDGALCSEHAGCDACDALRAAIDRAEGR